MMRVDGVVVEMCVRHFGFHMDSEKRRCRRREQKEDAGDGRKESGMVAAAAAAPCDGFGRSSGAVMPVMVVRWW